MMRTTSALWMLSLLTLVGCAAPRQSLYQWGEYENQVYARYNDPGKVSVEAQIAKLEEDYQKARSANRTVPPGFHAHLGYLYFEAGKDDQAMQSFQKEKALFPESATYINRILAKAKK